MSKFLGMCHFAWQKNPADRAAQRNLLRAALHSPAEGGVAVARLTELGNHSALDPEVRAVLRTHPDAAVREAGWRHGDLAEHELPAARSEKHIKVKEMILARADVPDDVVDVLVGRLPSPMGRAVLRQAEHVPAPVVRAALIKLAATATIADVVWKEAQAAMALPDHSAWALSCPDLPWKWRIATAQAVLERDSLTACGLTDDIVTMLDEATTSGTAPASEFPDEQVPGRWLEAPDAVLVALRGVYESLSAHIPARRRIPPVGLLEAIVEREQDPVEMFINVTDTDTPLYGPRRDLNAVLFAWQRIPAAQRTAELAAKALTFTLVRNGQRGHATRDLTAATAEFHARAAALVMMDPPRRLCGQPVAAHLVPEWMRADMDVYLAALRGKDSRTMWSSVTGYTVENEDEVTERVLGDYLENPGAWQAASRHELAKCVMGRDDLRDAIPYRDLLYCAQRSEAALRVVMEKVDAVTGDVDDWATFFATLGTLDDSDEPMDAVLAAAAALA